MKTSTRHIHALALLLTALLLSACHSYDLEESLADDQAIDILSRFNAEGKAWLKLEIPVGQPTSTRAVSYADGSSNEYAVHDVTLLFFAGVSESTATYASSYSVPSFTPVNHPHEQVTVTITVPLTRDNIASGDNVYVLAVLNNTVSDLTSSLTTSSTLATLEDKVVSNLTATYSGTTYYLMSNAPLANADRTATTTLVKIDPNYFFVTEAEAESNPASEIYVERAAAKVTMKIDDLPTATYTQPAGKESSYTDYYIKGNPNIPFASRHLTDYAIRNANSTCRLVRRFDLSGLRTYFSGLNPAADLSRFTESAALPRVGAAPTQYRTNWCEDLNYSGNMSSAVNSGGWLTIGSGAAYLHENTFTAEKMDYQNSTHVLVRLDLNNYTSFYTTSVTGSDVIYQLPTNPLSEEGTAANETFARRSVYVAPGDDRYDAHYYVSSARTIDEYLREWLMQTNSAARSWVEEYAAGDPQQIKLHFSQPDNTTFTGGPTTVTATQAAYTTGTGKTAFDALALNTYFASNITVNYYHDGSCYYLVPIRHFDDTETPWASAGTMGGSTAAHAYGSGAAANASYLGRYGVVRNNWYDIGINSINHVGAPNAATLFETMRNNADDSVEQLLNATLTITPWNPNNSTLTPAAP